jgi:hypothetical protein
MEQMILVLGEKFESKEVSRHAQGASVKQASRDSADRRVHVDQATVSFSSPDTEVSHIVSSILPQIHSIRRQHLQLCRRNPENFAHLQVLQGQLSHLTLQTLDLFQKEHLVHVKMAIHVVSSFLLEFSIATSRSFCKHYPSIAPLPDSEKLDATAFNQQVSRIISVVGGELTALSQKGALASRNMVTFTRGLKSLGAVAGALLNVDKIQAEEMTNRSQGCPLGEDVKPKDRSRTTPHSLRSFQLPTTRIDRDSRVVDGAYDDATRERVVEVAKALLIRDAPRISPTSITINPGAVSKIYLPYYQGFFRVPGWHREKEFFYLIDAQTGMVSIQPLPLTELQKLVGMVSSILCQRERAIAINALLTLACFLASRLK